MTESSGVSRRHFLTAATALTGGVGAVATAVPFVKSFQPSARAQALGAPVEQDISKLERGEMIRVEWRGRVIYILRRTEEMLSHLTDHSELLEDPDSERVEQQPEYAQNPYRSIRPEILVVQGVCTHLACAPTPRFDVGAPDIGTDWPGGFLCACHGSKFDLAGRVFKSVPAPYNLVVPPHRYINETTILIGADSGSA